MEHLNKPGYQSKYLLLICLLFSSCVMEKRMYRPGYYIESNSRQLNNPVTKNIQEPIMEANMIPVLSADQIEKINNKEVAPKFPILQASIKDPQIIKKAKQILQVSENNCTQLILYDDNVIDVILVEVGRKKVLYKACGQPDSETLSIASDLVYKIRYTNGTEYVLNEYTKVNTGKDVLKISAGIGIVAVVILILLLVVFLVTFSLGGFSLGVK